MKAATIYDLKQELTALPPKRLLELVLRLAKFRKENKELLSYLLFEAHDQESYIEHARREIDEGMEALDRSNLYFMKKGLRKVLKNISRYSRFMASKQAEAELLIHFCSSLKHSGINIKKSTALSKLFEQQIKKIVSAVKVLHEDLHYDYLKKLEDLHSD